MFKLETFGDPLPEFTRVDVLGSGAQTDWHIPEEVPVAFVYNLRNYAVMMATPGALIDFALGFSLTESVIAGIDDIVSLEIHQSDQGVDLRFKIAESALEKLDIVQRRRNLIGSASCGLCGLENAETLFKVLPQVAKRKVKIETESIVRAIAELPSHQPINTVTRSVHAAAWVSHSGDISIVREDVGRHNALDKVLGAMAQQGTDITGGFILMSSRCSYEIVEKAAQCGVQAVVSISGPTAFALRKAREANMAIYARAEAGVVEIN